MMKDYLNKILLENSKFKEEANTMVYRPVLAMEDSLILVDKFAKDRSS